MDPVTLGLLIVVVFGGAYAWKPQDRITMGATRGTAGGVRAGGSAFMETLREHWPSGGVREVPFAGSGTRKGASKGTPSKKTPAGSSSKTPSGSAGKSSSGATSSKRSANSKGLWAGVRRTGRAIRTTWRGGRAVGKALRTGWARGLEGFHAAAITAVANRWPETLPDPEVDPANPDQEPVESFEPDEPETPVQPTKEKEPVMSSTSGGEYEEPGDLGRDAEIAVALAENAASAKEAAAAAQKALENHLASMGGSYVNSDIHTDGIDAAFAHLRETGYEPSAVLEALPAMSDAVRTAEDFGEHAETIGAKGHSESYKGK